MRHILNTSYHPQANGVGERIHWQINDPLRAHAAGSAWNNHLPWVRFSLRAAPKETSGVSSAERVFGEPLPFLGSFSAPPPPTPACSSDEVAPPTLSYAAVADLPRLTWYRHILCMLGGVDLLHPLHRRTQALMRCLRSTPRLSCCGLAPTRRWSAWTALSHTRARDLWFQPLHHLGAGLRPRQFSSLHLHKLKTGGAPVERLLKVVFTVIPCAVILKHVLGEIRKYLSKNKVSLLSAFFLHSTNHCVYTVPYHSYKSKLLTVES
jgi:hypothetical protein